MDKLAGEEMIASLEQFGVDEKSGNENITNTRYTYNVAAQLDYTRTFNRDHNLLAMLLANGWQRQISGQYHRLTNANLGVTSFLQLPTQVLPGLQLGVALLYHLPGEIAWASHPR